MLGLTTLGAVHTAVGLIALVAGIGTVVRYGGLTTDRPLTSLYTWTTALTALTGFGIFQHGGFNIAHVLGILTLVVLAIAVAAGAKGLFGRLSPYVETIGFSTTLFFHFIPGITETFSRFPQGAPLFTGPEDPQLAKVLGVVFVIYLVGVVVQVLRLKATPPAMRHPRLV
ncbi:Uncharacterized membrane protein [Roseateles sp. YR242]|uniref:hypothetical protein n=1 Tax=Roseateles sp. YR242 TaxID=1855305 RepID=UPI0008D01BBC|nr:hypothetical protein [Roseateles sp. YR242]SEL07071.1 Uncharacterized membrane protein [Roseateles sp. YR242]